MATGWSSWPDGTTRRMTLEQDIHELRDDYQEQQTSLDSTIQELKANIAKLENENDNLKEMIHLQRNHLGGGLQKNPQMKADDNVIGLREELQTRYQTFIRTTQEDKDLLEMELSINNHREDYPSKDSGDC